MAFERLDITTNQPATQVYTAYWLDTPRKVVHGGPSVNYTSFSAVAIEQEGYIDAINTPEWGVDQICECDVSFSVTFVDLTCLAVCRWTGKGLQMEVNVQVLPCRLRLAKYLAHSAGVVI